MLSVSYHIPETMNQDRANVTSGDVRSEGVWDDHHIVGGRIVIEMNPRRAISTAKAAVEVFHNLDSNWF